MASECTSSGSPNNWTLRKHYSRRGGLPEFTFNRMTLDPAAEKLRQALMKALRRVILEGPVKHAGGALSTGPLFSFDGQEHVVVSGGLWRELSLLGHWIGDALLRRWAELTERLSKQEVRAADALLYLLIRPEAERDTSFARQIFAEGAHCGCRTRLAGTRSSRGRPARCRSGSPASRSGMA